MLNLAKTLKGYSLENTDGETMAAIKDFCFDDHHWTIRYLVAETGHWNKGRQVLISPYALVTVNRDTEDIVSDLTQQKIKESPPWDGSKPITREIEKAYCGYYGWPSYWNGPFAWGASPYVVREGDKLEYPTQGQKAWDARLRSTEAMSGYHIQATDGEIGHIANFIIDDETWAIRYLIVDTRTWWPGKRFLISPQWIERVSWSDSRVFVNLPREALRQAPEYTEASLLTREYESGLHRHYNRQGYWVSEMASEAR